MKGKTLVIALALSALGIVGCAVAFFVAGAGFFVLKADSAMDDAQVRTVEVQLQQLASTIEQYQVINNKLPPDLEALSNPGDGQPAFIKPERFKDPWGNTIEYETSGTRSFTLTSPGPDQITGTDDDIIHPN